MTTRKSDISWDDFPQLAGHCRGCGGKMPEGDKRRTAFCKSECSKVFKRIMFLMTDWNSIRYAILRRDNFKCVLCGEHANEVDHLVEIADGGSFWKPSNLRALCRKHHQEKTNAARTARAK